MKLLPPEPDIELYEDGFEGKDILGRSDSGKQLSDLIERIEDPIVVALDGSWGSGKSFFLKCWVGAHQKENEGNAKTIFFDAFAHDYLDDPLVALTGAIAGRIEPDDASSKVLSHMKAAASKLWRPAARIVLAAATTGATEMAVAAVDPMLEAGSKELESASKDFWKKEDGKHAAMNDFRKAISSLTLPENEGELPNKLVIVVDELDRCRPDYALALLETIKHFFDVPNVHFVLGVNLSELQNSVRARYGQGVDAGLYLQKFISLTMRLPRHTKPRHGNLAELEYFLKTAAEMKLNTALVEEIEYYLERILPLDLLSIRGMQKLLTQIALFPHSENNGFEQKSGGYNILISGLIILKHVFPTTYKKAETKTLTIDDVINCFNTDKQEGSWHPDSGEIIEHAWRSTIAPDTLNDVEHGRYQGSFGSFGQKPSADLIPTLITEYIESFRTPD